MSENQSPMKLNESKFTDSPTKPPASEKKINKKENRDPYFETGKSEIEGDILIPRVVPVKFNALRLIFSLLVGACFGFLPILYARWNIRWRRKLFYDLLALANVKEASHYLLLYSDETLEIVEALNFAATRQTVFASGPSKGFRARKLMYVFQERQIIQLMFHQITESTKLFIPLETTIFKENSVVGVLTMYNIPLIMKQDQSPGPLEGLNVGDAQIRQQTFGKAMIDIDIPHLLVYMAVEMTAPLYFVQYIAVIVWFIENNVMFAVLMLVFSFVLTIVNYLFLRSSMIKLREKAIISTKVSVIRGNSLKGEIAYQTQQPEHKPLIQHNSNNSVNQVQPHEMNIELAPFNNAKLNIIQVDSHDLVPGDLIIFKDNMNVPCDCVLLAGEIFVNEVTLTGESIPVPKSEIDAGPDGQGIYVEDQKLNTKSLVYEGTSVIKTRPTNKRVMNLCVGIVQRTGFGTFKGQIFRSLVFVKNKPALFQTTSGKFILLLAIIGLIVALILLVQFVKTGVLPPFIAIKIADMVIFVAPPAVPIMTTFCLTMSLARLRMSDIFGINPQSLLAAGKVTTCCFDKTGTLTDLHLDFNNFVLANKDNFDAPVDITNLNGQSPITTYDKLTDNPQDLAFYLFGTCHSIIYDNDGGMLGDPLDIKMFQASAFNLSISQSGGCTSTNKNLTLNTLKQFPFSSDDQCMSVLVRHEQTGEHLTLVKGSPEKLKRISRPESVPQQFEQMLNRYTMQGLRVLGMGYKKVSNNDVEHYTRKDSECELTFMGLIVFINRLKHDTAEVLARLKACEYKVKMISGDNSLTCAQTAKNASIVSQDAKFIILEQEQQTVFIREIQEQSLVTLDSLDISNSLISIPEWCRQNQYLNLTDKEFVMNGMVLESLLRLNSKYDKEPLLRLILKTALFGRCRPEHKAMVIRALRELGVICAMVGDGANDCPAIKAANLGISFAETDASISAPFSSMSPSISCIEKIMMEGKCTTQNSIEALRYYATTGMYKFIACGCLIFAESWFPQNQLIFMSYVFGTIIFNIFFGLNKPIPKITIAQPNDNLVSKHFIGSFFVHVFIGGLGSVVVYVSLASRPWYVSPDAQSTEFAPSGQALYALFCYSNILTVTTLFAMYFSAPFKEGIFKNYLLILTMFIKLIWAIILTINPKYAYKSLQLTPFQPWFAAVILGVSAITAITLFVVEHLMQKSYIRFMYKSLRKRGY